MWLLVWLQEHGLSTFCMLPLVSNQSPACLLPPTAGPSGCGKSATLTTLAATVGFDVSEWRPPPAVQWEEAQYAGIQRRQELLLHSYAREFIEFLRCLGGGAACKLDYVSVCPMARRHTQY